MSVQIICILYKQRVHWRRWARWPEGELGARRIIKYVSRRVSLCYGSLNRSGTGLNSILCTSISRDRSRRDFPYAVHRHFSIALKDGISGQFLAQLPGDRLRKNVCDAVDLGNTCLGTFEPQLLIHDPRVFVLASCGPPRLNCCKSNLCV